MLQNENRIIDYLYNNNGITKYIVTQNEKKKKSGIKGANQVEIYFSLYASQSYHWTIFVTH